MANFATESAVRLKFQLEDTASASSELIEAAIGDAHTEILRFLDPEVDTVSPEDGLVLGETLLAGAHVFRSLAAQDAHRQKHVTVGQQRIEEGSRFDALTLLVTTLEAQAWYVLEPYVKGCSARKVGEATDTVAVLGL